MNFSFPKTLRIRKNREFKRLSQKGKRLFGAYLVADYLQEGKKPRLGITVTKKFGKAHDRNYFKRLVREAFRLNQHLLPLHLSVNIRPQNRGQKELSLEAVSNDLKKFFLSSKTIPRPQEPQLQSTLA